MKRLMISLIGLCLFALVTASGRVQAQTPEPDGENQAALNRQLMAEIKQLRVELLRQSLELQQWKLKQIERELQTAQAEQQGLEKEERAMQQELAVLSTISEGQGELELLKAELNGYLAQKRLARRPPVNQRVDELTEQVNQEQARLRQLTERLKIETGRAAR
jgi:chromosome segregation ATPase